MANRIQLKFGQGNTTAIVDIRTRGVHRYCGSSDIHDCYGGKQYYTSRSGLSGAGWIPARPWLKVVDTYRVDVSLRNMFAAAQSSANRVARCQVIVPYDYSSHAYATFDYPCVVLKQGVTYLVHESDVADVLAGDIPPGDFTLFEYSVIRNPAVPLENRRFSIFVAKFLPRQFLNRVVLGLHFPELEWTPPTPIGGYIPDRPFWSRLGLQEAEGLLYKVVGGICSAGYFHRDLADVAALQSVAPGNVAVLSPNMYIQETDDTYDAVGTFRVAGSDVDVVMPIGPEEGVRVLLGHWEELQSRLREMALQAMPR